jgi:hypothetical protein
MQHVVHHGLKRGRCVHQSELHDHELEVAVVGVERRLFIVVGVHPYLMVASSEVQLGAKVCAAKFVEELIHDGNRELVTHSLGVQCAVDHAKAPQVVVFLYQKHQRGEGGGAGVYEALLEEHVVALVLEFIFDELRVAVWPDRYRRRVGEEVDAVIVAVRWRQP